MMPQLLAKGALAGLLSILLMALPMDASAEAEARPRRIVSLNLCVDQLLLALADRDQILSLSPLVDDPSISYLAGESRGVPTNAGKGEAILFSGADLVVSGSFGAQARLGLLRRQGIDVMVLDAWRSLAEGRAQIRALAERLGHPARGEALIARIDAALKRAEGLVQGQPGILVYQRRGWVPASRSIVNEILQHMGFRLHQERLGLAGGGLARLESIVASPPDYVLFDEIVGSSIDHGSALLSHPALARVVPPERRLAIPGELAICGGPSTPALIDALAAEAREKLR